MIKRVFAYPQVSKLADALTKQVTGKGETALLPGHIDWARFENGFPNLFIKDVDDIDEQDVVFLANFESPETVFEQLAIIHALPRYGVRSLTIVLPYFPTGTMERVDEEGQIATAMTLARLLSATPMTMNGPSRIVIYDIHALPERFYFGDTVIPKLVSAIPLLKSRLEKFAEEIDDPLALCFPDEGARKRFGKMFPEYPHIICDKIRDGKVRKVFIKEGDPRGYHVVIVDDLVITGGTNIECKNVLFSRGASGVSGYVTHPVFPLKSWKRFIKPDSEGRNFTKFWITDSCPNIVNDILGYEGRNTSLFEVLSLTNPLHQLLTGHKPLVEIID